MTAKKQNIKSRVFIKLLLLLIGIFTVVFLAFNIFMGSYIKSNVEIQLNALTDSIGEHSDEKQEDGKHGDLPDVSGQPKSDIGVYGEVFVVDRRYEIVKYSDTAKSDELLEIVDFLKTNNIPLNNIDSIDVSTSSEDYYISSAANVKQSGEFYIFYVNVTAIDGLDSTINNVLGIILIVALLISFTVANWIANAITKPVKKIKDFAVQIGKSNFTKMDSDFKESELSELVSVMNQSADKLERYDSEQKTFFQNVSHELRTPLMSIKCYAEGVSCGLMDAKKSGKIILSETDKLSELIEDLLYISHMDTMTQEFQKEENDLRETVAACAERQKPIAEKQGLRYVFDFSDTPVMLTYNEKHIARACMNLISNAIRYAKTTITIGCKIEGNQAVLSVADDGVGIAPSDLPHIFERFYKGQDGKHGIGLSIVKSVASLHEGTISVNCDNGTRFKIVFPVAR